MSHTQENKYQLDLFYSQKFVEEKPNGHRSSKLSLQSGHNS